MRLEPWQSNPWSQTQRNLRPTKGLEKQRSWPVAVIRSWPDSEDRLIEMPLVPLHDQLMRSADQVNLVGWVKLLHHVTAEQVSSTTGTDTPALGICMYRNIIQDGGKEEPDWPGIWPSGSDQRRSHIGPSWGTSCLRSMDRIWSSVWMDGDRPPCTQKIWNEMPGMRNLRFWWLTGAGNDDGRRVTVPFHQWWQTNWDSQRSQHSISTRWWNRISVNTRRKIHRLVWFVDFRGSHGLM